MAFFVITLGGPVLLCWCCLLLMILFEGGISPLAAMMLFLYLPVAFVMFGSPASATLGLCAAISIVRFGKIRITTLLWGFLMVAIGAAWLLHSPNDRHIVGRYGLWYSLLALFGTVLMVWPAKKLCDGKPPPCPTQSDGN